MKKNNKKMRRGKKGFTIIEILVIVVIIAILATVVLVGVFSSRKKAGGLSAFSSLRSTAASSFSCLTSGLSGVRLTNMETNSLPTENICFYASGYVPGYSSWPDISKSGWETTLTALGSNGFHWCNVDSDGTSHPTDVGSYTDTGTAGSYGGRYSDGSFCYMLEHNGSYIWCTLKGCFKEGF